MSKEKRNGFVDDTKRQVWIDGRFFELIEPGEELAEDSVAIAFLDRGFKVSTPNAEFSVGLWPRGSGGHYRAA